MKRSLFYKDVEKLILEIEAETQKEWVLVFYLF